jgi:hypothetical protein
MKVTETGAAVYDILVSDAGVSGIVGNRIFPLVAKNATTFPFIAYRRSSVSTGNTKDGPYRYGVVIDVACVGNDYKQGVDMADAVMNALQDKRFARYDIDSVRLGNASEDYPDDAFVQTLEFLISINK